MSFVLYLVLAAAVYVFLWVLSTAKHRKHPFIDDDAMRLIASLLWPSLFLYVGLKMYERRQ